MHALGMHVDYSLSEVGENHPPVRSMTLKGVDEHIDDNPRTSPVLEPVFLPLVDGTRGISRLDDFCVDGILADLLTLRKGFVRDVLDRVVTRQLFTEIH